MNNYQCIDKLKNEGHSEEYARGFCSRNNTQVKVNNQGITYWTDNSRHSLLITITIMIILLAIGFGLVRLLNLF